MYSDRSLDIVCADRREFEVWTTALQVSVTAASHDLCDLFPQALLNGFTDREAVETAGVKATRNITSSILVGILLYAMQLP